MTRKLPRLRIALVTAVVVALAVVPAALAGKGGNNPGGGGGSLSLVLLNSTDGVPHYGQQVTFNVATTATDKPMVGLDCYQNGAKVYWASAGFFADYPWQWARNFTLASSNWTGGAADCTATLYYWNGKRTQNLASLSFHVYA